ncbi:hypothetical protein [Paenibacillus sp. FSL M7-0420]|uniref:hypothetical protein n=1 Tax=Paenibacillus sp. FSL M7-0420 TaxID=2921609 RepID=UPI0030F6E491
MDLQYIGVNSRSGRKEWIERELARPYRPDGMVMKKWKMEQYVPFMETIQDCIGRCPTKEEHDTIAWLSSLDPSTIDSILSIIKAAKGGCM